MFVPAAVQFDVRSENVDRVLTMLSLVKKTKDATQGGRSGGQAKRKNPTTEF